MRHKQIDEIYECIKYNTGSYDDDARSCAEILYDYLGYRKSEWISVEDRLPKACDKDPDWSDTVLFRTAQGYIYSGYRYKGRPQTSFYDDSWSLPYWLDESERLEFEDEGVTHWMPLPEPPKEKES